MNTSPLRTVVNSIKHWWTGLAFLLTGIASIMLSFHLKKIKDIPGKISDDLKQRIESIKNEYHQALHK